MTEQQKEQLSEYLRDPSIYKVFVSYLDGLLQDNVSVIGTSGDNPFNHTFKLISVDSKIAMINQIKSDFKTINEMQNK